MKHYKNLFIYKKIIELLSELINNNNNFFSVNLYVICIFTYIRYLKNIKTL